MAPWVFLLKKKKFYKTGFTSVHRHYYISPEQHLPRMSALLVIIKDFGLPKYRTLNIKLEEVYLLLLIAMTIFSKLTASAPKHK